MNAWSEIDGLRKKFQAEYDATVAGLEVIKGAGKLSIDEYGVWKVRCRKGNTPSEVVTARGGGSTPRRGESLSPGGEVS